MCEQLTNYQATQISLKHVYRLLAIEHTKSLTIDTFIFTNNLNNIYLLQIHIQHPSSQNNHLDKPLIAHIIYAIKNSTHNISITKVRAHTNIILNDEADEANNLAKLGALEPLILLIPFHHIGPPSPYISPTQQLGLYFKTLHRKRTYKSFSLPHHQHHTQCKKEWTNNKEIHIKQANLFWNKPCIIDAQISQV